MMVFGQHKGAVETLIIASILAFIVTLVVGSWVYTNFALKPSTVFAKPWTIVSSMFMHSGFGHLIFNMIALFFFGIYLERVIGEENLLRVYFLGGAFASVAYVITSLVLRIPPPYVDAVGASGAIFAVMGALVVLRPNITVYIYFIFPMPLYVFMIIYVFMTVPELLNPVDNIAHNAHLGGLLAGLLFGNYFKERLGQYPGCGGGMYGCRFV
jgi:membrane associated rhomboid family serine protease